MDVDSIFNIKEFTVLCRAPLNFFLSGEHCVMFGEPALCQPINKYFYVALKRIKGDSIRIDPICFPDPVQPESFKTGIPFTRPDIWIACKMEKLLWSEGFKGIQIGLLSEAPTGCGLASSGALGAALALGLQYLSSSNEERRSKLLDLIRSLESPQRILSSIIQTDDFKKLFRVAWKIDALFHRDASSGANAFFGLVGSPKGLPASFKGDLRDGDYVPQDKRDEESPTPSRANDNNPEMHCKYYGGASCLAKQTPKELFIRRKCPDYTYHYRLFEELCYSALDLHEIAPEAEAERCKLKVALIFSGVEKSTDDAIKAVAEKKRILLMDRDFRIRSSSANPWTNVIQTLGVTSQTSIEAMARYDYQTLMSSTDTIQAMLRHHLGVSEEGIDDICQQANKAGIAAKLTGGGKGGDVVLLSTDENELENLTKNLNTRNHRYVPHLDPSVSSYSRFDFRAEPVTLVRGDPRYVLLHYDIQDSSKIHIEIERICRVLHETADQLSKKFDGYELPIEGNGGWYSFVWVENAVEFSRELVRQFGREIEKKDYPEATIGIGIIRGVENWPRGSSPAGVYSDDVRDTVTIAKVLKSKGRLNAIGLSKEAYECFVVKCGRERYTAEELHRNTFVIIDK